MQPSGSVKQYYDTRAPEYDEWYLGLGKFAGLDRPGWHEEVAVLERVVSGLCPANTLDIACGTGFLTQHLRGRITALDQSERMLAIAGERIPDATFVQGDALELPFDDGAFDRVFTGHFYGHLEPPERERFLAEARRVAPELVVVDAALRPDRSGETWETRVLNDGSRFEVFKRYFEGSQLVSELAGSTTVLHDGDWFVVVSSAVAA